MSKGKRGPMAKPRYRAHTDRWEVRVDGNYVPILDELGGYIRGDSRESEQKAYSSWHLQIQREQAKAKGGDNLVAVVLDLYLDEVKRLYPSRYVSEARTFQNFIELFPDLVVNDLTERHIDKWFEANPQWKSPSTRKTRLASLTAAFNWASKLREGQRIIPLDHPLREVDLGRLKNKAYHRSRGSKTGIADNVHVFLMVNTPEDFRNFLFALRHSGGTRPGNVCKVTAEHLDEKLGVWIFEEENTQEGQTTHKTYGKTREPLVVPLTAPLVELCKQLREKYPTGPLFRTEDGRPWTAQSIAYRFDHHVKRFRKMGVPIPDGTFAYAYRHESATSLIASGVTDAVTAAILGHKGTSTLHGHYNHPQSRASALVNVLRAQVNPLPGEPAGANGDGAAPGQSEQA